ncbi:MAG: hypothetical protein JWO02_3180 [Solirubrobacterales bacterium]|nr:hypothetical protein [Solirubrobacterales bacterium]
MRNARLVVLALMASSFIAAGCGDNNKDTPATAATSSQTTAAETTTAADPTTSTASDVPKTVDAAVTAAIESCKQSIDAQPTLDASLKTDLKNICEKAASGDAKAAAEATKQVCTKIVEANVPAGAARDQALAACKTTG